MDFIRETHHRLWCLLYLFHKISCTESIILLRLWSIQTCSLPVQTRTLWYDACRQKKKILQSSLTTYLFQATHKVVADRRPRQVCCTWGSSDVEKVIWSKHGIVFLRVACCGQDAVHRYSHLIERNDKKRREKSTHEHQGCDGDSTRNRFASSCWLWSVFDCVPVPQDFE